MQDGLELYGFPANDPKNSARQAGLGMFARLS